MMFPRRPPTTVEEAVQVLLAKLDTQTIERPRTHRRKDLIGHHFGLGMWIRDNFGLWKDDSALLEDTGQWDPDDASIGIIEALWERLQAEG
jgi:hypothetical protein